MKFKNYEYRRPDINVYKEESLLLIKTFEEAKSSEEQITIMKNINTKQEHIMTMVELV